MTIKKTLLRSSLTLTALVSLIVSITGCSSDYQKLENIRFSLKEYVFTHAYDEGPTLSIVCRENAGTATVAARIVNTTSNTLTLNDRVALFIEGHKVFERPNSKKIHSLKPGESLELPCEYTFSYSFTRDKEIIFPGQQRVSVEIDTYRSPEIFLDLSADNHIPFRFANVP